MKVLSRLTLSMLITCCLMMGISFHTQAQMVGGTIGSTAPNIELPDQYENKVSLSDLRGNLVLVRFWKSGDPNSRATNMNIDALHQKYQGASFQSAKSFEVFTVSLDSRLDKWRMALQEDQLPAKYHVSDIYSKYVAAYGVRELPANFLLDENGVIIASTKSMAELDKQLSSRARVYGAATRTVVPSTNTTTTRTVAPSTNTTTATDLMNTSDKRVPTTFNQPATIAVNAGTTPIYMIQLGAYKNWDKDRFLDAAEYGMVTTEDVGNGVKRALLGKFTSLEDVVNALSKLQGKGYMDAFPVEYKNNGRRIIGRKEVATLANKAGVTIMPAPVRKPSTSNTPATMNIASTSTTTTPAPAIVNTATVNNSNGHYEYPFANSNSNSNPITSIPDEVISTTYHNEGNSVITTTTGTNTTGNVATYHAGGGTVTNNSTLVPSEIPVFTGGVNPANNNSGTYYDSDAYELSWYPSEPSTTQPNIIESPYYNSQPVTKKPNVTSIPNYENNGNGWQQQGWQQSSDVKSNGTGNNGTNQFDGAGNGDWKTTTNNGWQQQGGATTTNNGWQQQGGATTTNNGTQQQGTTNSTDSNFHNNGTQQPNMNGQWDNNGQNNSYPQPNNGELDKSLDNYLDGYDFSSVDDNSEKLTTSKKKKKKRKKNKKKKRR
ncbi:MAG: redoxin domain-containing protein [Chitinophagales bacterium]